METGTLRHPRGGLYFEDFSVGQLFRHRLTRTVTQMDNMLFSNITLNPQPLHIDAHFCATETEWGRPLMNSLFTLGLMIGISVNDTTVGTTIANLGMTDVAFPVPLFEGDTIRANRKSSPCAPRSHVPTLAWSSSSTGRSSRTVRWSPSAGAPRSCAAADPRSSLPEARMRSLVIAPPDEKRLAEARASGADAVIVDLALAAPEKRAAARAVTARFLKQARAHGAEPALVVGVNALDSGETDADLDAVMGSAPDAILLPGSFGAASVQQLSAKLAVREADFALADGATRIIAVADTARALLSMASYRGSSARLAGIAWSAASLRPDIGAETDRDPSGAYAGAFRLARDLTLLAAAAAGLAAIDAAFADVADLKGLRAEAAAARRDGFLAKLAIDPVQPRIINETFAATPRRGPRPMVFRRTEHTNP